jgi:hypothetical protein
MAASKREKLEEEVAERLLLSDRRLVEHAEPDVWIVFRLVQGPGHAPVEVFLVLGAEYQQLSEGVGEDFVPGQDVVVVSEHAWPLFAQPVQLLQAAGQRQRPGRHG